MRTLPREVTWLIDTERPSRTLCLEASAPERVAAFLRRCPNALRISQPWGYDAHNRPLDARCRRNLRTGIYRSMRRPVPSKPPPPSHDVVRDTLEMVASAYGCVYGDLIQPRHRDHARARGYACHRLRQLGLSQCHISSILGYKDHTGVAYWLARPVASVLPPDTQFFKEFLNADQSAQDQFDRKVAVGQ